MSSLRSASENTPLERGLRGNSPWAQPNRNTARGADWRTCSAVPNSTWSTVWGISDTSSPAMTSFSSWAYRSRERGLSPRMARIWSRVSMSKSHTRSCFWAKASSPEDSRNRQ